MADRTPLEAFSFDAAAGKQEGVFDAETVSAEADNQSWLEAERKRQAEAAQVQDARFIGYAEVLDLYNQRADTEPLADRRARHLAVDPADQDFARKAKYTGVSETVQTSRTEGAAAEDTGDGTGE